MSLFGGTGTIRASGFHCNGFDLDIETFAGRPSSLLDEGDNVCGCDGVEGVCKAVSSQLQAPEPIASDL